MYTNVKSINQDNFIIIDSTHAEEYLTDVETLGDVANFLLESNRYIHEIRWYGNSGAMYIDTRPHRKPKNSATYSWERNGKKNRAIY